MKREIQGDYDDYNVADDANVGIDGRENNDDDSNVVSNAYQRILDLEKNRQKFIDGFARDYDYDDDEVDSSSDDDDDDVDDRDTDVKISKESSSSSDESSKSESDEKHHRRHGEKFPTSFGFTGSITTRWTIELRYVKFVYYFQCDQIGLFSSTWALFGRARQFL